MKEKKSKNKQSKIEEILYKLFEEGFFTGEGRTTIDVVKRLAQRGFTVKGRKIGMVARMLTKMCQDSSVGMEREELLREKKVKNEMWAFKEIK